MGQILTLLKAVLEEEEIYTPTPDLVCPGVYKHQLATGRPREARSTSKG